MSEPVVYEGRVSEACADGCQEGDGCGRRGPYTSWCGGCCACRGGCVWGYHEQVEAAAATAEPGRTYPALTLEQLQRLDEQLNTNAHLGKPLTAEPGIGAVVRDSTGCEWVHAEGNYGADYWLRTDSPDGDPESWGKVAGNYGPVWLVGWEAA